MSPIILYGSPMSLYTGRARSYLIKAHIDYREEPPISRHYRETVAVRAGGRRSMPTVELPDSTVIRDGVAIVDHFENQRGHPFSPPSPKQRIVSRLFDVIGAEGLIRPAMHYRWNFSDQNFNFLRFQFQAIVRSNPEAGAERIMQYMQRGENPIFRDPPETHKVIETLYEALLQKLNAHFSDHPYLLGGKPCIGDFGMMAPLYGHLGRDPKPLSLMQARAGRTFRWVERMNRPEPDVGEFAIQNAEFLAADEIPDTLIEVLKHLAIDFVPETCAACQCINEWLDQQDDLPPGATMERGAGMCNFQVCREKMTALAQPFRFYVLKRVQDEFESLDEQSRGQVSALLSACDMLEVLDFKISRNIGRANNLEVWL